MSRLYRILLKNQYTFKSVLYRIVFCIFIWIFFVYIIYSFLFGLMNQYNRVGIYDYVRFDAVLNDVYVESCNSNLTRNENVDALLKTFYIGGPVYRENDERIILVCQA